MNGKKDLETLCECLCKLPGVGRRSAERIAVRLVRDGGKLSGELASALRDTAANVTCCRKCGAITSTSDNPCRICSGANREQSVICVVEEPFDIVMIERSGAFRGKYHALMGKISPMNGDGPGNIRVKALISRIGSERIDEVILALSTDVEGDATATFVEESLKRSHPRVRVTRLALGLPAGSGVRYSDSVTLARAINGRSGI